MKTYFPLAALLLISLFLSAQSEYGTTKQSGLQVYRMKTVNGMVTVNLPDEIYPGETISGSVLTEPEKTGNTKKDNSNRLALLAATLNIFGNTFKVAGQIFSFSVPKDPFETGPVLVLENEKGLAASTGFVVQEGIRPEIVPAMPDFPVYLRSGEFERIPGSFDGDMANTRLMLNDMEIPVAAESPGGIVTMIPENLSGLRNLSLTENRKSYSGEVNIVNLKMNAGVSTLRKGEQTTLHIEVEGLRGLEVPVTVHVDNLTPMSIGMQGGNQQVWVIHPEETGNEGIFRRDMGITATASGNFSVSAGISEPPVLFDMTGKEVDDLFSEEGQEADQPADDKGLCGKVYTTDWKDTGKNVMELDHNNATRSTYRGRCENCSTNVTWNSVTTPYCRYDIFERQVLTCKALKGHTGKCHGTVKTEQKKEKDPSYTPKRDQEIRVCQKCGRSETRWVSR